MCNCSCEAAQVVSTAVDTSSSLKTSVELGFVILVVVLVVIGLLIGFKQLREKNEPPEIGDTDYHLDPNKKYY